LGERRQSQLAGSQNDWLADQSALPLDGRRETGELLIARRSNHPWPATNPLPDTLPDGRLIVLGEGGKLGLFALNPHQPEELCVWQIPQLRYPCWTAPVLAHKKLYLQSEERLLCFDLSRRN
jgi:hypothetical protein